MIAVPDAACPVYRHPLLVATLGERPRIPRDTPIGRLENIAPLFITIAGQTVVKKVALRIGIKYGVGAKNSGLDHTGKRPSRPCVGGITPTGLSEIAEDRVELPPTDSHFGGVGGVNGDGGFVRGIIDNVLAQAIDVDLGGEYIMTGITVCG